jgi:hypothetical protein
MGLLGPGGEVVADVIPRVGEGDVVQGLGIGRCEVADDQDLEGVRKRRECQLGQDRSGDRSGRDHVAGQRDHAVGLEVQVDLSPLIGLADRHEQRRGAGVSSDRRGPPPHGLLARLASSGACWGIQEHIEVFGALHDAGRASSACCAA